MESFGKPLPSKPPVIIVTTPVIISTAPVIIVTALVIIGHTRYIYITMSPTTASRHGHLALVISFLRR